MTELGLGLTYAIAAIGAAIGIGMIGAAALNALGRNPEKAGEIRTMMVTAIVFAESIAIIGLVAALILKFV